MRLSQLRAALHQFCSDAALQLAAISIRDRPDRSSFIASFAGDDRYVVDYLADEVLEPLWAPLARQTLIMLRCHAARFHRFFAHAL